jgi:MoaA/NifB/PqqE/SkfB family radical SAM enzyme
MTRDYNKQYTIEELREDKVFCTKAWGGLSISPSGSAFPCCLFEKPIADEKGQPYKVWETDIKEIYNSGFMKDVRKKMLCGESVDACKQCYQSETYGGDSLRIISNHESYEKLPSYKLEEDLSPVSIDLKLNNKCNLKCRMCQPRDSHLVQNEFQKIIDKDSSFASYSNANMFDPDLKIPLSEIPSWEESEIFLRSLKSILGAVKKISMVGGEPLIMNQFYEILDLCISEGRAKDIYVAVTTNLMYAPKEKLDIYLESFHSFLFNISLDAVGEELNYIRFPSTIEKVEANFKKIYREDAKGLINFQFTPTVQVYNAMYIHKVYEFVDRLLEEGYKFSPRSVHLTYLTFPMHLNIRILPEKIRKISIKRLKSFLLTSKHLVNNPYVIKNYMQLIKILANDYHEEQDRYLSEFLYYTYALDKERNQQMKNSLPDLYNALADLGVASKKPAPNFHSLRDKGWKHAQSKEFIEAISYFEEAVEYSDEKYIDYREIGWMKLEMKDFEGALNAYESAYELKIDDENIVKGLIITYRCLGKHYSSFKVLKAGKKTFKGNLEALKTLQEK